MANEVKYFTYRFSNLPKTFDLNGGEDAGKITGSSIAPCTINPESFNVATVTFRGKPSFSQQLHDGEGVLVSQSSPSNSIRVDDHFLGITTLHHIDDARAEAVSWRLNPSSGSSSFNVQGMEGQTQAKQQNMIVLLTIATDSSVIAVTGLGGRPFGSWQNRHGSMWLRDFLPLHVPNIRVHIYGYPSSLHKSPSRASIHDYTSGLIQSIMRVRRNDKDAERPLILVGHSLGCILIKSAIVEVASLATPIPELHQPLCGIVFFGAPHRGLHNQELEDLCQGTPPEQLLSDLRPESPLLIWLNQRFPPACKDVKVISCYETHETASPERKDLSNRDKGWARTGPTRFQVPRISSCLDWPDHLEVRIPIHADHSKIAKLDDTIGSPYHEIKDEIAKIVDKAHDMKMRRLEESRTSQDLLDLFLSLQYEISMFRSWEAEASKTIGFRRGTLLGDSRENTVSVHYGHPTYPLASEASWIMESLGRLLQRHGAATATAEPTAGTQGLTPTFVSLIGLPPPFFGSLFNTTAVTNLVLFPKKDRFNLGGWDTRDISDFASLVDKLCQVNKDLSEFDSTLPASWDMAASCTMFNLEVDAGGTVAIAEAVSRQRRRRYPALDDRTSFLLKYGGPMSFQPTIYPVDSIDRRTGSKLSNFRLVSPFRPRQQLEAAGKTWVLVEWQSYRTAKNQADEQKAKDQAVRIAHDLGIQKKPPRLRTLGCVGLVQDWDEHKFGFLFQIPNGADVDIGPVSLSSYLSRCKLAGQSTPLPTLGDRIRLAHSLACTLAELHFAGILHRAVHSGNILLFPDRGTKSLSRCDPYLAGFGISRPEQDESLSLSTSQAPTDDYQHPELRAQAVVLGEGGRRRSFHRRHDVYSLGLVLLEVGLWMPLQSIPRGLSPEETAKKFLSVARSNLPHHMGPAYCQAVVDCIDFEQPWLPDVSAEPGLPNVATTLRDSDARNWEYLTLFVEKVVRRLESCHCQA